MKIAFVLVAHLPMDERVYFQQAESLRKVGNEVFIISSRTNNCQLSNVHCFDDTGISKRVLICKLFDLLSEIKPEIIICDNPISIIAANKYKKKLHKDILIFYDVTEWYPSKKNLRNLPFYKQIYKLFFLCLLSIYGAYLSDRFIFGEYYKAKPFRILFPLKKNIFLPYYANIELIKRYPERDIKKECKLFYSGSMTIEKGFDKVLDVAIRCAEIHKQTNFILNIISGTEYYEFPCKIPDNLAFRKSKPLAFFEFCSEIGKSDIFFDLRTNDIENTRCLPIKIFYYMACNRPVIYSNLKAIKKGIPDINKFGYLVDPENISSVVSIVSSYLEDENLYKQHCLFAGKLADEKYNWLNINDIFVDFVLNNDK